MTEKKTDPQSFENVILETYKKVTELEGIMRTACDDLQTHRKTLYGAPNEPKEGLVWKISQAQQDISLIKKVAFALVPGTGAAWVAVEFVLKLIRG